jgi:hypothetical protein
MACSRRTSSGLLTRRCAGILRARVMAGSTAGYLNGESKAGKSRTMFEAVRAELTDAFLLALLLTRENLEVALEAWGRRWSRSAL